jgi:hypothetical protein
VGTVLLLLTGGYFLVKYRISQVVKLLVEEQSQGQYRLEMGGLDLSILKRKIELTHVSIMQTDVNASNTRSVIKLPKLYLQLRSWNCLLQKNLLIDSLFLASPPPETLEDSSSDGKISFQTLQPFDILKHKLI